MLISYLADYGTNDPVARKMLAKAAASTPLAPPADTTITSLYFTSVPSSHNDVQHFTDYITPFLKPVEDAESSSRGIRGIVPVQATNCAFVNFKSRQDAEAVAEQLAKANIGKDSKMVKISFGEEEVGVQWGRSKKAKKATPATAAPAANGAAQEVNKPEVTA